MHNKYLQKIIDGELVEVSYPCADKDTTNFILLGKTLHDPLDLIIKYKKSEKRDWVKKEVREALTLSIPADEVIQNATSIAAEPDLHNTQEYTHKTKTHDMFGNYNNTPKPTNAVLGPLMNNPLWNQPNPQLED